MTVQQTKVAVFGGGCFWCTEAVFRMIAGVESVTPGYAGGETDGPSYEQVSSGTTGHAEVIRVVYDSAVVAYPDLLNVFFTSHDPTTMNRQGNDVGTQYRSVIFAADDAQRADAAATIERLTAEGVFDAPIVTEILPLKAFYPAEEYHRDYYANNRTAPYCTVVIDPKVKKVRERFSHLVRRDA
jgi:methionine-S-sulfoxide reductase